MIDVCITDAEYADLEVEASVFDRAGLTWKKFDCRSAEEVASVAGEASALLVQYAPIDESVMRRLPNLKVISRYGTGYDNIDVDAATRASVWVANVPVYGGDEVPIHTLTLMLACVRGLTYYEGARREGTWPPAVVIPPAPSDLSLGIVGLGRIGRRVAELASALFGEVRWFDPTVERGVEGTERVDSLEALLRSSNVLTLHVPLTEATRGLVGANEMRQLVPPRVLVNTSRAGVVDQEALIAGLRDETIWAAGLDVFEPEVGDWQGALASERLLVTPHAAWASLASLEDVRRRAAENIVAALTHGRPITPVNEVVRHAT